MLSNVDIYVSLGVKQKPHVFLFVIKELQVIVVIGLGAVIVSPPSRYIFIVIWLLNPHPLRPAGVGREEDPSRASTCAIAGHDQSRVYRSMMD
jgi:hypothetical protein